MNEDSIRLIKVLRKIDISLKRAIEFLNSKNIIVEENPNSKISVQSLKLLVNEFCFDNNLKVEIISNLLNNKFDGNIDNEVKMNDSDFILNEHREFKIIEQKERSTILLDELTGITYPSKKISKLVNDKIIMQIFSIDNFDKPLMRYSVLNDFIEGTDYDFDVVEKKDNGFRIENSEDITSFIPLSYEKHINSNKIRLTVDKIDKVKNQLFFKAKDGNQHRFNNNLNVNDLFTLGEKYKFKVEGFRNIDDDISIILLDYKGYKSSVKSFSYQNIENLPDTIICQVTQITENRINLLQDRFDLLSKIYNEGKKYDFNVVSLENDSNTNSKYFILSDKYGFLHKLYNNEFENDEFENIEIGQSISLYVKRIAEKGYMVLYINASDRQGLFITVESIFDFINKIKEVEKYFYFIRDELTKEIYKEKPYSQLFEDYGKKENLWIFSYLSFLHDYIQNKIKENQIETAIEFLDLYLDIEEWMLEGSDFLQKFSVEKRPIIINKAENQLKNAKIKKEALLLIKNNQSDKYIQDVLKTLRLSSYLRDDKVNVFKNIIFNTSYNNLKNTNEIVEIILLLNKGDLLDNYDISNFIGILEHKINVEKYDLNPSLLSASSNFINEDTKNAIQNIIKILGLQIILNKKNKNHENAVLKSSVMFRYLSHLCEDENIKLNFLKKAINCIVTSKAIDLNTELVSDFNFNVFEKLVSKIESKANLDEFIGNGIYKNNGEIYSNENGWAILSRQQVKNKSRKELKLFNLKSFFNNSIHISSTVKSDINLDSNLNINECNSNWRNYYINIDNYNISSNLISNNLIIGQNVKVIAKNYMKNNNKLLFLKIIESDYEGEGVIFSADVFRNNIEDFEDVIVTGDEFNAEIKKIDDRGITFTFSTEIWNKTIEESSIDDVIDAKVIHRHLNTLFLVTENGHFASFSLDENEENLEERKVYKFKIIEHNNERQSLKLSFLANSERFFNEKKVIRDFLCRTKIIRTSEVEIDNSKNVENFLAELIICIEHIMHFEKDNLQKVEYLQLLKLLSSINRSHKSYYYETLINYFQNIYNFKDYDYDSNNFVFEPIDERTLEYFKSLEIINDRYKYLSLFNKLESIQELIEYRNELSNIDDLKLINMLLAHNLLISDNPDEIILKRTKDLIFEFLSNEKVDTFDNLLISISNDINDNINETIDEVDEVILNLGKEGTYREFKSSIVFYAGSNKEDFEKQSSVIMKTIAGFLNSKGGSLFIGVNDLGDIIGLSNDYLYFGKSTSSDKYEREIRALIVKSFNKDINSLIEIKFLNSNDLEYCEIIIPSYDKPIAYFDNFYQRQGNETRIITGSDLIFFFERKLNKSSNDEKNLIFNINRESSSDKQRVQQLELESPININLVEENIDFYSDKKSQNNQLDIDYNVPSNLVLAYMYIYINGKYVISSKKIDTHNSAEEIVIYNNFKNGYLLQCYDNGCVNKVEVRTLLEKTLGRVYSNGFSLQGNLIGLFLIQEDCLLMVKTKRNDVEYIKIIETEIISIHNQLNLKGNNVVQEDYDLLCEFKIIDKSHKNKLIRIVYKSKQLLGVRVDKLSYKTEIEYLTNNFQ